MFKQIGDKQRLGKVHYFVKNYMGKSMVEFRDFPTYNP